MITELFSGPYLLVKLNTSPLYQLVCSLTLKKSQKQIKITKYP